MRVFAQEHVQKFEFRIYLLYLTVPWPTAADAGVEKATARLSCRGASIAAETTTKAASRGGAEKTSITGETQRTERERESKRECGIWMMVAYGFPDAKNMRRFLSVIPPPSFCPPSTHPSAAVLYNGERDRPGNAAAGPDGRSAVGRMFGWRQEHRQGAVEISLLHRVDASSYYHLVPPPNRCVTSMLRVAVTQQWSLLSGRCTPDKGGTSTHPVSAYEELSTHL